MKWKKVRFFVVEYDSTKFCDFDNLKSDMSEFFMYGDISFWNNHPKLTFTTRICVCDSRKGVTHCKEKETRFLLKFFPNTAFCQPVQYCKCTLQRLKLNWFWTSCVYGYNSWKGITHWYGESTTCSWYLIRCRVTSIRFRIWMI